MKFGNAGNETIIGMVWSGGYLLQGLDKITILSFLQFGGLGEGKNCVQHILPVLPLR